MSQLVDLEKLKQHRDALLLAEVAALLHDMSKLTDIHVEHHSASPPITWSNDDAYKAVVDNPASVIRLSPTASNIRKPDILNNVLNAQSPKAADYLPDALKNSLQTLHINLFGQDYSLAELIMLGMPGFATHQQREQLLTGKDGWLPAVLGLCHNIAHVDKEDPIGGLQSLPDVLTSSAFGYEQKTFVVGDPQAGLTAQLQRLVIDVANLADTRKKILATLRSGLGDTRRPTNEVTLADWSAMVAALFKTALSGAILTNTQPKIRQWASWRDKLIDHDFHWRLLRVNFDVLGLYAKAVKIADLLGYQRAVEKACERVKQLVEEEYPLGNEVYRDTTGIYFTFPDLDLPAELAQKIRRRLEEVEPALAPRIAVTLGDGATATEQLKGILTKARREAQQALAQPFDHQNLSTCWQQQWETVGEGKWEVCPVCRLRPMREGREACAHCEGRRGSRIAEWQATPRRTIWMDELADANGRVALLVGKFGLDDWLSGDLVQTMLVKAEPATNTFTPKNPSSARLRRVWETCQRFWAETAQGILDSLQERQRWLLEVDSKSSLPPEGVVCDGTLNGSPISVWRVQDALLTVSFMPEKPKPGTLSLSWAEDDRKKQATYQVQEVSIPSADYRRYHPTLTLLASPDQFLTLLPAADALAIADKIRDEYEKQFGKVRNRLPLFLGLVFFPRKMPLLAVMDTARRMLESPLGEETWTLAQGVVNGQVTFTNGEQWTVPVVMGDDRTSDEWYPYWFIDQVDTGKHQRRFQLRKQGDNDPQKVGAVSDAYANRWLVHVNDLKEGDKVFVTPSRFAYIWLEHTAQRFAFDPQRDLLLLDELQRLIKMWKKIGETPEMTDTKLRGVQALLEAKGKAWGKTSDEFQNLVQTTLKRAGMLTAIAPDDVIGGRFTRCLELYTQILKQKVKED